MLNLCVTAAHMYGLETMALTEKQQVNVQLSENNWIRRIVGVKRADKRKLDQFGVKENYKKKLVRSRFKWAVHVERMGDEKLGKR